MASVCSYFQVHQPFRLRRYSVFDSDHDYFDDTRNRQIVRKVAQECYLPTTGLLLDLIRRHDGAFRVAFSLTGCVIDQFREYAPEVINRFEQLARTGACEYLAETYHHSLAFLYSRDEFAEQLAMQTSLIKDLFGRAPEVFRNTELIYNNELAACIGRLGYRGILAEGADQVLGHRSPNFVYEPPGNTGLSLLLKNYRLSDDIAFRFSDSSWDEWPLTAQKYAAWLNQINGSGTLCNLFMDLETFGEHQRPDTGIFEFLEALPALVLADGNDFRTPSEAIDLYDPVGVYDAPHLISWADTERDLSAWLGNSMQSSALHELYKLESSVKSSENPLLIADWRKLTTSDHFYYMCTKYFADGDVHQYFNPYDSPYDSYINFMNVLDNLRTRVEAAEAMNEVLRTQGV